MFFILLKLFPKEKNRKKRKPSNQGGQAEKPKGNGISPEGWQGHTATRRSYIIYAVVFWLGGALGVRFTFATFLFFLGTFQLFNLVTERQMLPLKATLESPV